jgi:restriction endonuclease
VSILDRIRHVQKEEGNWSLLRKSWQNITNKVELKAKNNKNQILTHIIKNVLEALSITLILGI